MAGDPREAALRLITAETVRRTARILGRAGIEIMPLKGALWQVTLYSDGAPRPLADVDVLVPERDFGRARALLTGAGFRPKPNLRAPYEEDFSAPELLLPVDLHRSLFAPGRFRMDTAGLFARARRDRDLFGASVLVADPRDQLAHLLGHLAKDHRPGEALYQSDLERLITRERLEPGVCAGHLDRLGLGRAARFALRELASPASAAWIDRCLAALAPDPLGEHLARLAARVIARRGRHSRWSSLAGLALDADLPRAAAAALRAAAARARAAKI
jgi:hypothetical protein